MLATANKDKAADMRQILSLALPGVVLVPRPAEVPEVEETGETLEENALLKARALRAATGMAAIADDTGLEVDALNGAPGVYSARYSGEDATYESNIAKLLTELGPRSVRTARFRSVVAAVLEDGAEVVADGEVAGRICEAPRGRNGFGYDPVFVPDEGDGRTFAEMQPQEKHALSHRGRALRSLAAMLARL